MGEHPLSIRHFKRDTSILGGGNNNLQFNLPKHEPPHAVGFGVYALDHRSLLLIMRSIAAPSALIATHGVVKAVIL